MPDFTALCFMSCALPRHSQYLELFLAFNAFQIEEPSDLLFFFFFSMQQRILLHLQIVDGWFLGIELVLLKNGLFFCCLLDFTPRCGHQVWSCLWSVYFSIVIVVEKQQRSVWLILEKEREAELHKLRRLHDPRQWWDGER